MRPLRIAACVLTGTCLPAADIPLHDTELVSTRVGAEALVGSVGFEGGLVGEFRWRTFTDWQVRPEVFINKDSHLGAAVSLSWDLDKLIGLPAGHELFLGPRVAYHNTDHDKWALDAMGLYSLPLFPDRPSRHNLEIIGTLGYLEHRDDNDETRSRFGAAIGVGYVFSF